MARVYKVAGGLAAFLVASLCAAPHALAAGGPTLSAHVDVEGLDLADAEIRRAASPWRKVAWDALGQTRLDPGPYEVRVRFVVAGDDGAVALPACADRRSVSLDGRKVAEGPAPMVSRVATGRHEVVLSFVVGRYEHRVACGERPRVGRAVRATDGLGLLRFDSPYASRGGGQAVVYVPPGHDVGRAAPVLVGAHPWNGSIWTYAAYAELIREARVRDVVMLMPSGLGNSLYTADAEDEVMRALSALAAVVAVDPSAVSIWGASMGGAGATTIGFHRPDRFASVTSFFGDSRYDLSTYVRGVLPDEASAHRVNALDIVENARHLQVWLVHGREDRTSAIVQSQALADALRQLAFDVRFDAVPRAGHEGALVARFLPELVARAATVRIPRDIARVTYRSVRAADVGAYGVRIERSDAQGDAFVDVEREPDGVHVRNAQAVHAIRLTPGALGSDPAHPPPIVVDVPRSVEDATWEARP
jgi:enterochelin esterase-like enzyme